MTDQLGHLDQETVAVDEQLAYARIMDYEAKFGFSVLIVSFVAYATGFLPALVPFGELGYLWSLPLQSYIEATGTPIGWAWVLHINRGDLACLLGVAFMAGSSLPCLLVVIPIYEKRRDRIYVALCVLEIVVILAAASGLVVSKH